MKFQLFIFLNIFYIFFKFIKAFLTFFRGNFTMLIPTRATKFNASKLWWNVRFKYSIVRRYISTLSNFKTASIFCNINNNFIIFCCCFSFLMICISFPSTKYTTYTIFINTETSFFLFDILFIAHLYFLDFLLFFNKNNNWLYKL